MLSRLSKNPRCLVRSFAAINGNNVNLATINPSDIHDSTPRVVGSVMAALSGETNPHQELCDEIDEFWRTRFRKVSFEDAKEVMNGLSEAKLIEGLDDKFWVWETLEEATRPYVDQLDKEETEKNLLGWVRQLKGSEYIHD